MLLFEVQGASRERPRGRCTHTHTRTHTHARTQTHTSTHRPAMGACTLRKVLMFSRARCKHALQWAYACTLGVRCEHAPFCNIVKHVPLS